MRLSTFGIWIALISIVKCQNVPDSGCYDVLTRVTAEVPPIVEATICADDSVPTVVVDSPQGFWFNNIQGFCTSFDYSTGFVDLTYLVASPSLSIQLMKHGDTLDAAKVSLDIQEQRSGTHLVTVWGHQSTRFVLQVMRTCNNVETPDDRTTTQDYGIKTVTPLPKTTSQTTHGVDEITTENNIRNEITTTTLNPTSTTESNNRSIEIAKIEWMEKKRLEFEKKLELLRNRSDYEGIEELATDNVISISLDSLSTRSMADYLHTTNGDFNTQMIQPSYIGDNTMISSHGIVHVTNIILPSDLPGSHIQPTTVVHAAMSIHSTLSRDEGILIQNTETFPFGHAYISSSSHSIGPAAFFTFDGNTKQLSSSDSTPEMPVSTTVINPNGAIIPSNSQTISSFSNSHQLYSSQNSNDFSSSSPTTNPPSLIIHSSTNTPPTYLKTRTISPTPSSSLHTSQPSSAIIHTTPTPPSTPGINTKPQTNPDDTGKRVTERLPTTSSSTTTTTTTTITTTTTTTTATTPKQPDHLTSTTIHDEKESNLENSTMPQKKTQEDFNGETFWPVVAALVVGIPSVVVFGIAIVVIHRRRAPMARKIFAMRSFSNLSTPSSSLPGYTHIKRTSPSQSTV